LRMEGGGGGQAGSYQLRLTRKDDL
jgi:hypothetical protein